MSTSLGEALESTTMILTIGGDLRSGADSASYLVIACAGAGA